MKSIAPAYSVIVLSLILLSLFGFTLTGMPVSVFAQESATTSDSESPIDESVETLESTVATSSESNVSGAENSVTTEREADPYPREKLMSDNVYSDFVVGPGRFQLEVGPGQSKTVEMTVTNRMGIPKTFQLTTEDMSGTNDPAESVQLLGERTGPYTIKDYISVPARKFVLQHGERVRIPVTVSIPADAEPGGFYGSLLTQIVSEDTGEKDGDVVPGTKIISRIGTLFFVTTPGEIAHESELKDFGTTNHKKFYTKGPIEFNIVTENTGSVHVTPFGELHVYNTLGNEVGYVEIQPWYVLPNSVRNKELTWNREFMVGRYTAVAQINRGYDGIVDEVSYTFWVIPLQLLAAVFGGFFVFFILIRFFFSRFEFKRKGS